MNRNQLKLKAGVIVSATVTRGNQKRDLIVGLVDQQLREREGHYQGAYNGLRFRFSKQVEQIDLLNDTLKEVNELVEKREKEIKRLREGISEIGSVNKHVTKNESIKSSVDLLLNK